VRTTADRATPEGPAVGHEFGNEEVAKEGYDQVEGARGACGQIDIGNAATTMTERVADGVRHADRTVVPNREWMSVTSRGRFSTWPACR
jgi:hypothetical protein